jgi:hypothetical protein
MAKKTFDPNAVTALLAKGKREANHVALVEEEAPAKSSQRPEVPAKTGQRHKEVSPPQEQPAPKKLEKRYVTLFITSELFDALYDYQLEYRKSNPRKNGLHPGIGGATERLLRQALKLPSLEASNQAST